MSEVKWIIWLLDQSPDHDYWLYCDTQLKWSPIGKESLNFSFSCCANLKQRKRKEVYVSGGVAIERKIIE